MRSPRVRTRIAVAMRDFPRGNAETLTDDFRENSGVPLAGVLHAETHQQGLVARKRQHRAFGRRAAGVFEQAADAEAAIFASPRRLALALLEAVIVGKLQRLVEDRFEIA